MPQVPDARPPAARRRSAAAASRRARRARAARRNTHGSPNAARPSITAVAAGLLEHAHRVLGAAHVAVADHRDADRALGLADHVPVREPLELLGAGAGVDRDRRGARVLERLRHLDHVPRLAVPAEPDLGGHRQRARLHHARARSRSMQRHVLQQRRARAAVHHLAHRAAHVDVHQVGPPLRGQLARARARRRPSRPGRSRTAGCRSAARAARTRSSRTSPGCRAPVRRPTPSRCRPPAAPCSRASWRNGESLTPGERREQERRFERRPARSSCGRSRRGGVRPSSTRGARTSATSAKFSNGARPSPSRAAPGEQAAARQHRVRRARAAAVRQPVAHHHRAVAAARW